MSHLEESDVHLHIELDNSAIKQLIVVVMNPELSCFAGRTVERKMFSYSPWALGIGRETFDASIFFAACPDKESAPSLHALAASP